MSILYTHGLQELMGGNIDLTNDDILVVLVSGYVPDFENDRAQSDIPEESQVIESTLFGKTLDGTRFLADDVEITNLTDEREITGVVLLQAVEDIDDSTLISFMDGTGFPFTPDGSPITICWDRTEGGPGIFKI